MNATASIPARRISIIRSLSLAAFSALLALFLASPALAASCHRGGDDEQREHAYHRSHDRHWDQGHHRHRGHDRHHAHRGPVVHGSFAIPLYISPRVHHELSPYFYGEVSYPAHRHAHDVYSFPHWNGSGWGWQPVEYCGGRRFTRPRSAPRIHLELDF